jgi:hypothetical protein
MTEQRPDRETYSRMDSNLAIPPIPIGKRSAWFRWIAVGVLISTVLMSLLAWTQWISPHRCEGYSYDRDLFRVGDQCIGTIASRGVSFGPHVTDIINKIGKANEAVDRAVQQDPDTGWVRIAVAMPMTGSRPGGDDISPISGQTYDPRAVLPTGPIVHALRGAYVAQERANTTNVFGSHRGVQVKIVLMNMGSRQESWTLLKPKIRELAQDTAHPLVAVVGLGVSRTETDQFARWLHSVRVPAIGAVLSAVGDAPGLFNVSPSDEDYVTVLHRYLPTLAGGGPALRYVQVVDQNGDKGGGASDLYVADLHRRFQKAFGALQIWFQGTAWDGSGHPAVFTQVVQDVCGSASSSRPVVLFGGRPRDLQPLLDELADARCPNEPIVAAAATGVVVNATMRSSLTKAKATLVLVSSHNTEAWLEEGGTVQRPEGFDDFVKAYRKEVDPAPTALLPSLRDGYALGLHDAVGIAVSALRNSPGATEELPPNGPDLMIGLQNTNTEGKGIRVGGGKLHFPNSDKASYACGRAVVVSQTTGTSRSSAQVVFTTTTHLRACQPQSESQ